MIQCVTVSHSNVNDFLMEICCINWLPCKSCYKFKLNGQLIKIAIKSYSAGKRVTKKDEKQSIKKNKTKLIPVMLIPATLTTSSTLTSASLSPLYGNSNCWRVQVFSIRFVFVWVCSLSVLVLLSVSTRPGSWRGNWTHRDMVVSLGISLCWPTSW